MKESAAFFAKKYTILAQHQLKVCCAAIWAKA